MPKRIPVIIDTDVALDDWMAILYLLMHPGVHVLGITTTGVGAAHLKPGTQNVLDLLQLAGHASIPVAAGTNTPLRYSNVYPGSFRQQVDSAYGLPLPRNPHPPQSQSAADFLAETLAQARAPVKILSIGGATNLALLLAQSPSSAKRIERIVMMGGAIDVPGNVAGFNPDYTNQVAEWNFFVDPRAARQVFASTVPITLVPLDASNHVPLDRAFFQSLQGAVMNPSHGAPTPASVVLYGALCTQLATIDAGQYFFWDPLAAVALTDPQLIQTHDIGLTVRQTFDEETDTSGQTARSPKGRPLQVAFNADADAVRARFLDVIAGNSWRV
jgi:inosine-uridine nucleoside N-ribohydrolase